MNDPLGHRRNSRPKLLNPSDLTNIQIFSMTQPLKPLRFDEQAIADPSAGVIPAALADPASPPVDGVPHEFRPHAEAAKPWRRVVAEAITDPAELCRILRLPARWAEAARQAGSSFPLLVPRTVLSRMEPGNPRDPVLRQFFPVPEELERREGFSGDPLAERSASPAPRVLAKYSTRLLMLTVGGCPVHCRYCFRRHLPYEELMRPAASPCGAVPKPDAPSGEVASTLLPLETLRFLESQKSYKEIVLSGGEPLLLDDSRLFSLILRLSQIPHLTRVRIHTRMPIVIPQRVTDEFAVTLKSSRLTPMVVLHVNHPQEIDDAVAAVIGRLVDAGVPVLSQSVLLAGINDRTEILAELCERLADLRVIPYYLHQLDRVEGAAHFEVPVQEGIRLIQELRALLPGYMVPRYVRESPDSPYKVPLA